MQEDVLRLALVALSEGAHIARKTLVMYIVQMLSDIYPQASKTCVGHVVQLLYRASAFNVFKRENESSLMQLKEEFRCYEALRREHDGQIVQIAKEAGLKISPDQWSSLLYGDQGHRTHMQSIIEKMQTPLTFKQTVAEFAQLLNKNPEIGDRQREMLPHLNELASIELPNGEGADLEVALAEMRKGSSALQRILENFVEFNSNQRIRRRVQSSQPSAENGYYNIPPSAASSLAYKAKMCHFMSTRGFCRVGDRCRFAHSLSELNDGSVYAPLPARRPDQQYRNMVPLSVENLNGTVCGYQQLASFQPPNCYVPTEQSTLQSSYSIPNWQNAGVMPSGFVSTPYCDDYANPSVPFYYANEFVPMPAPQQTTNLYAPSAQFLPPQQQPQSQQQHSPVVVYQQSPQSYLSPTATTLSAETDESLENGLLAYSAGGDPSTAHREYLSELCWRRDELIKCLSEQSRRYSAAVDNNSAGRAGSTAEAGGLGLREDEILAELRQITDEIELLSFH